MSESIPCGGGGEEYEKIPHTTHSFFSDKGIFQTLRKCLYSTPTDRANLSLTINISKKATHKFKSQSFHFHLCLRWGTHLHDCCLAGIGAVGTGGTSLGVSGSKL